MFDNFNKKFQQIQFNAKLQQAFLEDMVALVNDGVPANRAIETIRDISTGVVEEVAEDIAQNIARGQLIATGMEGWFSNSIIEIIRAGETSGTLPSTLESAADSLSEQTGAIGDVITAIVYPLIVMIGALGMVVFVKDSVFNSFAGMKPVSLWPSVGQNMYYIATFLQHWWWLLIIGLVVLTVGLSLTLKHVTGNVREVIDKVPLLSLYREMSAARLMQTLGLLLKNGVAFNQCLGILQRNAQPYIAWHLMKMELRLSRGQQNIADVLDTGMVEHSDLVRLRVVAQGSGFENALTSLGAKAAKRSGQKISKAGKIMGGLLLAVGAGLAATMVFAIYTVGSIMAG